MQTITWLDELAGAPIEAVGGKARSLGRLAAAGFRVPQAFAITTAATPAFNPGAPSSDSLRDELAAAFRRLCPGGETVAVRSSAVDEDSEAASFAGQHLTLLGVRGEDEFLAAVRECVASLHSEAAVAYRARAGGEQAEARMAVVVQHMVEPRASGVAFSIDPITGDHERVVVEAVAGRGEALVSGQAEGDRVVLQRGTWTVLEEHYPGAPALTVDLAREVAEAAVRAEEQFGGPQDIEFAADHRGLWMLQSRPITAVAAAADEQGWVSEFDTPTNENDYWTSANVQEVLPGLLTPMTMSIFQETVHEAYTKSYQRMGLLDKDEWPMFVGLFHNRAYLNINATREIADRAFGSSGDAAEHRYLGGEYKVKSDKPQTLRMWKYRLRSAWPVTKMTLFIYREADRLDRETAEWEKRVGGIELRSLPSPELERVRRELQNWAARNFAVHLQSSACAGGGFDMVSRQVEPVLGKEAEGQIPALFTGMQGVESAQIGLDMWGLSRIAVREGMAEAIRGEGFEPAADSHPSSWREAWAKFLKRHGHRGVAEMEPAAKTWRSDPAPVLAVIRSYLDLPEEQSPVATLRKQEQERLRLTEEIAGRMNPVKRRVFRWTLQRAQGWVALRERTKSIVVRAMRISDVYLPEFQRRLLEAGAIDQPDDVFYLTSDELTLFLTGKAAGGFQDTVARRRREMERNRHVELPERFHGRPVPLAPDLSAHAGDVLHGTPVSPGMVTGRARVIFDPAKDGPLLPGEILVAPVTDAGWTPLFALASGLVVDMGSALSHGSTVAREYGLPAVVNVRRGTRVIKTGDLVRVDGAGGTVTILEE